MTPLTPKPHVQSAQVMALPVNQSGRRIKCFACQQEGHKRINCPNKVAIRKVSRPALPTQREAFKNHNKKQFKEPTQGQPKNVTINYVSKEEEMKEQTQVYPNWKPNKSYQLDINVEAHGGNYEERIPRKEGIDRGKGKVFL